MPRFIITHVTKYTYEPEATESYSRMMLSPLETFCQNPNSRRIIIEPSTSYYTHRDYFGNLVHEFSVPYRHRTLEIQAISDVVTYTPSKEHLNSNLTVSEAQKWSMQNDVLFYDYLAESNFVKFSKEVYEFSSKFFAPSKRLSEAIMELNTAFTKEFKYRSGSTNINTPIHEVIKKREGVCQDFSHVMIACLRMQKIPARYVSGYIESYDPETQAKGLVGSEQSHAWLDVYFPYQSWFGIDPTNNMISSEQHIRVAIGRDFGDVSPVRGTFKGAGRQTLTVDVKVRRAEYANIKLQSSEHR
jgi:transglutaminase-like putative cysteine protease